MIYDLKQFEWKDGKAYASVRDYIVKDHIAKKKTLRIVHQGEFMDLTPAELKSKKVVIIEKAIKSIVYQDQYYYLYSYLWKPSKKISQEEKEKLLLGY